MNLIGKNIINIREMTKKELDFEGWDSTTMLIELEGGIKLYPSRDEEGNGGGCIFGKDKDIAFIL